MVRLRLPAVVLLGLLPSAACGDPPPAADAWTIWIATDAPTPSIADRARIELLDGSGGVACDGCARDIALPTEASGWPLTQRFERASSGGAMQVRVRLYRGDRVGPDGVPRVATTIDRIGRLPVPIGNTDVSLELHAECIGVASDAAAGTTCAAPGRGLAAAVELPRARGVPGFAPGTWERSRLRRCSEIPPDGIVCVPGGFFIAGDAAGDPALGPTSPERYVMVSPFYLDRRETTVGAVRALVREGRVAGAPLVRAADPADPASACTYLGPDDGSNDALPVNCVTRAFAAAVCAAQLNRLLTEVEWEWAAGNLGRETTHPWSGASSAGDACDLADVGRGRDGREEESRACRTRPGREAPGLPAPASTTDLTALRVEAMAGGLSEWVADGFERYDAPCWSPGAAFVSDPQCPLTALASVRGSGWASDPALAASFARRGVPPETASPAIGFRCARSALE
jgi:formylglycine-generating enzyme required for sulfatase activity